ncbi:MAG TPA: M23 family metallopeptidase, partial [Abditibacteriaceae bacterium]
ETNAMLQSQWHLRNRLQRNANEERERIARAEETQRKMLTQLYSSRTELLAYSEAQAQSSKEIESMIGDLTARRAAIIAQYEAEAAQARAAEQERYAREQYNRRRYSRRSEDRPRRYRRRRVARRVTRVKYVRSNDGELKPMAVSELQYHTEMAPVEESGMPHSDEGGEHYEGDGHLHDGWGAPVSGRMSSRYGMRFHPVLRRRKLHTGADLAAGMGTPFRAARSGRVLYSGWKKAYGNTIIIDHGDGTTSLYGHASKLGVRAGQPIRGGEYIGNVGSTGYSTGPHLHFEVRKNGRPVDPSSYIRRRR